MNVRTLFAVGLIALAAWNLLSHAPSLAADPVEAQMQAAGTLAASLLPASVAPQPQPAPQPDESPRPVRPARPKPTQQSALGALIEPAVLLKPCPGGVCPREEGDCPGGVCPRKPQRSADCECADCACADGACAAGQCQARGHGHAHAARRVGPVRRFLHRFRLRHGWRFRGGCRRCG